MARKKKVNIRTVVDEVTASEQKVRDTISENIKAQREGKPLVSPVNDSFVNFAFNVGIGSDNPLTSSTYGFNPVTRNRVLLEWMHRGSWLAGIIVDCIGDDMTRAGVDHEGEVLPDDIARLEEVATGLDIWGKINETIKWSRLYGGALGVLLIDGQDMSTPLRIDTIREGQFCGLAVVDRWMVEPSLENLVTDFGPDLGLPKFYRITFQAPCLAGRIVHHSRCIRLTGIKLPYWQALIENLWGLSVLERIYDRMVSFDSATTGAAQLVYKAYLRTYKVKDLREVIAAGGDALLGLTQSLEFMRRYQSIEGVTLIDAEDELTADAHSAFSGLSDILQQFEGQLGGGCQIPLVRLFGQSPAGFSTGETDLQNYYDNIKQNQEKDLRIGVTKVYRCIAASCGIELPDGWKLQFRNLWEIKERERAEIISNIFDVIARAEEGAIIDKATALKELKQASKVTGIFTNITDEMIEEAENEMPPIPENNIPAEQGIGEKLGLESSMPPKEPAKEPSVATETESDKIPVRLISNNIPVKSNDQNSINSAGICLISKDNKILLLRRSEECEDHVGEWAFPGGHVENGEIPLQTALRELKEETGIKSNQIRLLPDNGKTIEDFIGYPIRPVDENNLAINLNKESDKYGWFNLDDLPQPMHPNSLLLIRKLYKNSSI